MKKFWFLVGFIFLLSKAHSQVNGKNINDAIDILKENKTDEQIGDVVNGIIKNPEIYNKLWGYFLSKYDKKWKLLKNINVKFKTFQDQESVATSLGFSYEINYDIAKREVIKKQTVANSFGFAASGNVAFKKKTNPDNLLETNINYSYTKYLGGFSQIQDTTFFNKENEIEDKLALIKDPQSKQARELWEELGKDLKFSNEYFYNVMPHVGFESNQDFSKIQFTPSLIISAGAKAWDDENTLAKINFLDYPFALLRLLFNTDKKFTPYGSTIPDLQFGFTYVVPVDDSLRSHLLNNSRPFPRFKFETGFRTIITRIVKENIFFNANFRYYKEINAPQIIKTAKLNEQTYFVMALQSTSGFFVSYSTGKLPLDATNDQVYSVGFNYKF